MDAQWASVWVAAGALVVSLVAAAFTGVSLVYARAQRDAALRQANSAEAQTAFMARQVELMERELEAREEHWARDGQDADATPAPTPPGPVAPGGRPDDGLVPVPPATAPAPATPAPPPSRTADDVSPWSVAPFRGDRYHLTNGSGTAVHDVTLEIAGTEVGRWPRVDPADPAEFRASTPGARLVVRWRPAPGDPVREWTTALPRRR